MNSRKLPASERLMVFSAFISFGFLFYRCIFAQNLHYTFLLWNLVMSFIPYIISKKLVTTKANNVGSYAWLLAWLMFLPACIYPITDLIKLNASDNLSIVYDVMMFLSFAVAALLPGLTSLRNVETFLRKHTSEKLSKASLLFFIFLSSYSACVFRFLHLKSWNVLSDFKKVFFASENGLLDPADHFRTWSVIIALVLLVDVLYAGFKKLTGITTARLKS